MFYFQLKEKSMGEVIRQTSFHLVVYSMIHHMLFY